jgi:GH35 family endo-1,4-beta-xylanase
MAFAKKHGLRGRMHTMIWDHAQQPDWANALLDKAVAGDEQAKRDLRQAISNRIKYYVRDRAANYVELDVLNESLHQDKYWKAFGAAGIADIYQEVAQAAKESGATPQPLLMTNEFNVLQWSRPYPFKDQPFDHYANWYRSHVEELLDGGAPVTGIGIQYNVDFRPEANEKCPHSAARIFAALQNLSVLGRPLTLTEFQITPDATPQQAAKVYYELMRLVYGNAQMRSFLVWGFWAGNTPDLAVLANKDWTLTPAGRLYERLMKDWTTDVKLTVSADHTVAFNGHFGEYEITAGDKKYRVTIRKGVSQYDAR